MPINEYKDGDDDEWEKVTVTVDSGAVDHVGPKHIAAAFETKEEG